MSTGDRAIAAAFVAELDALQRDKWALSDECRPSNTSEVTAERARRWVALYEREAELWRRVVDSRPGHDLLSRAANAAEIGARTELRAWQELAERCGTPAA